MTNGDKKAIRPSGADKLPIFRVKDQFGEFVLVIKFNVNVLFE